MLYCHPVREGFKEIGVGVRKQLPEGLCLEGLGHPQTHSGEDRAGVRPSPAPEVTTTLPSASLP